MPRCTQVVHTVKLRDNTMLASRGIARLGSRLGSLCSRWNATLQGLFILFCFGTSIGSTTRLIYLLILYDVLCSGEYAYQKFGNASVRRLLVFDLDALYFFQIKQPVIQFNASCMRTHNRPPRQTIQRHVCCFTFLRQTRCRRYVLAFIGRCCHGRPFTTRHHLRHLGRVRVDPRRVLSLTRLLLILFLFLLLRLPKY
jgi:hypothetical protein